jgi:hypothetical protein
MLPNGKVHGCCCCWRGTGGGEQLRRGGAGTTDEHETTEVRFYKCAAQSRASQALRPEDVAVQPIALGQSRFCHISTVHDAGVEQFHGFPLDFCRLIRISVRVLGASRRGRHSSHQHTRAALMMSARRLPAEENPTPGPTPPVSAQNLLKTGLNLRVTSHFGELHLPTQLPTSTCSSVRVALRARTVSAFRTNQCLVIINGLCKAPRNLESWP